MAEGELSYAREDAIKSPFPAADCPRRRAGPDDIVPFIWNEKMKFKKVNWIGLQVL